jgi:hypothetical protein
MSGGGLDSRGKYIGSTTPMMGQLAGDTSSKKQQQQVMLDVPVFLEAHADTILNAGRMESALHLS